MQNDENVSVVVESQQLASLSKLLIVSLVQILKKEGIDFTEAEFGLGIEDKTGQEAKTIKTVPAHELMVLSFNWLDKVVGGYYQVSEAAGLNDESN